MRSFTKYPTGIILLLFLLCFNIISAQKPELKHSYTFNDGTATDVISGANGVLHGATIKDGALVASEPGDYLELPAADIKISSYTTLSFETFITASKGNSSYTMFSYFGNTLGGIGKDYIFQSLVNGGGSKTSISCKTTTQPWNTETSIRSVLLLDGKPHHIVTTFDNKELKFYIDGVLAGTSVVSKYPDNKIENLGEQAAWLCKGGYNSDPTWKGIIDEFNIYEGILDNNTIAETAKKYIPNLDLAKTEEFIKGLSSTVIVDDWGKFDKPLDGEHIFFAELIASEMDDNNYVDEILTFSDVPMDEWADFSSAVRLSNLSGYLDVWNVNGHHYLNETKKLVQPGQVYQCWIKLDVPENRYSVYAKTVDEKKALAIWENAGFRKKVKELTYWSTIHNSEYQHDAMKLKALSEVDKVGDFPKEYSPSVADVKTSVLENETPKGAIVVNNPQYGAVSGLLEAKKIVLTNDATNLFLRAYHSPTNWIAIPTETYIQPAGSDEKLYITDIKGVPMKTQYYSSAKGYTDIQLIFPAIDPDVTSFLYKEENGNWSIDKIQLKEAPGPDNNLLYGNWFNTNTGDWEFSLLDTIVIYKNKVWYYTGINPLDKKGVITLSRDTEKVAFNYQIKKGQLTLQSDDNEIVLSHDAKYSTVTNPPNPPAFEAPLLNPDTAIVKGFCYGYSPGSSARTGTIYVDNILTGNQDNYLVEIKDDGTFSINLPTLHPQEVFVRMPGNAPRLIIEPGKEVFVLMNLKKNNASLVMGANARLMSEYLNFGSDHYYMSQFYNNIYTSVLDMSPEEFKFFCMMKKEEDLERLTHLVKQHKLSDRYNQKMKEDIISYYNRNVLHYNYIAQSAYRQKNNIPNTQRTLPVSFDIPKDPKFYSFLNPEYMNNELSLLGGSYSNFINAFKYSNLLQSQRNTYYDFIKSLDNTDIPDNEDKAIIKGVVENISDEYLNLEQEYFNNHFESYREFNAKYKEELAAQDNSANSVTTIINSLLKSDTLSDETKAFYKTTLDFYNNPLVTKANAFLLENNKKINNINDKYKEYRDQFKIEKRNRTLKEDLGIMPGLVSDICALQDILGLVVDRMTPLTEKQIKIDKEIIISPVAKDYLTIANNATLAKIEANKLKTGYTVNDVPETEAERIFDTIISKYRGKVIYVDFWATWCGPCRNSMQNQKAMKESLKDKDIVFVYITSPSSPEGTYKNMIPDIKGEHYRVSSDEWNFLCSRFNITGIPHYFILNKQGEMVNDDAPRDPGTLMKIFDELLKN